MVWGFSAIIYLWLDFGLPPHCPQVLLSLMGDWAIFCHAGSGGLAECDQPGKNPLKYSTVAGNWTRATGRTDSEIHSFSYWAIMTRTTGRTDSKLCHWAIMTRATGRTDSKLCHWAIMISWGRALIWNKAPHTYQISNDLNIHCYEGNNSSSGDSVLAMKQACGSRDLLRRLFWEHEEFRLQALVRQAVITTYSETGITRTAGDHQKLSYEKFELWVMLSLCFSHLATAASPFHSSVFHFLAKLSKICEIFFSYEKKNNEVKLVTQECEQSSHRKGNLVAVEWWPKVRDVPSKLSSPGSDHETWFELS